MCKSHSNLSVIKSEWRKIEIWYFFVIVLLVKDYMPLFGDKIPFEYVCIHLNLADNYGRTILICQWKIEIRYLVIDFWHMNM